MRSKKPVVKGKNAKNDTETRPYFAVLYQVLAGWQEGGMSVPRMSKKRKQELAFFSMKEGASPTMIPVGNVLETASRVSGL